LTTPTADFFLNPRALDKTFFPSLNTLAPLPRRNLAA